ncbi:MAG: cytochrome d ubiquinol oxidase subunit II [Dehalococcoidia bacterium]|nr:cytochrome d ubiquinol oxidase subunit II [Dehalococcoidia bacterium]
MTPEALAGMIVVIAIVAYAVLGGADFGGGIWSLFSWGERAEDQRDSLEHAIGPVWETNHVWLILVVVALFTVFPAAYAAIFTALYLPLFLALIGICARGAAFAFRHYGGHGNRLGRASLRFFSGASILTPFTFGLVVGAVTGGKIEADGADVLSGAWAGWLEPFALMCGLIGLLICAFVGAAFMVPRTGGELQRDFRRRAIVASLALGAATTATIPIAHANAPEFAEHLGDAEVLVAMALTAATGTVTLLALWRGATRVIPLLAGATVTAVIVSWALAQRPYLLAPDITLESAAAEDLTVVSFLIALPLGSLILVPSLLFLYWTFSRDRFAAGDEGGR